MTRWWSAWAVLCGVASSIQGCRALPDAPRGMGTCGIAMAVWMRDVAHARYLYYTVEGGELAVGGGVDALNRSTRWRTALTAEQCELLSGIVRDSGWLHAKPEPPDSSAVRVDVSFVIPQGEGELVTSDAEPGMSRLLATLADMTAGRFDRALDKLPEAGMRPPR